MACGHRRRPRKSNRRYWSPLLETFVSQLHLGNARRLFPMHNRRASRVFNVTRLFASVFHDCKWRCNFFLTQCVRTGRFMFTTRNKSCTGTPPSLQMVNNFEPCNPFFRPPASKLESGGDDPFCDTKAKLPSPVRISCGRQVPGGTLHVPDPSLVS